MGNGRLNFRSYSQKQNFHAAIYENGFGLSSIAVHIAHAFPSYNLKA